MRKPPPWFWISLAGVVAFSVVVFSAHVEAGRPADAR
jgi:hypothetical protein